MSSANPGSSLHRAKASPGFSCASPAAPATFLSPCKPVRTPIKCGRYLQARLTKTRFCKYLLERGTCGAGSACAYAHSEAELVPKPDLRKTKLCYAFLANKCKLGDACSYAHTSEELREVRRLILPLAEEASNAEPNCSPYVEYVSPAAAPRLDREETACSPGQPDTSKRGLFIPLLNRQVLGTRTRSRERGDSTPETPLLTDHPQLTAAFEHSAYTQAVKTPVFAGPTSDAPVLPASDPRWYPATTHGNSVETQTGTIVALQSQFVCMPPGLCQSTLQSCSSLPDWQQPSHTACCGMEHSKALGASRPTGTKADMGDRGSGATSAVSRDSSRPKQDPAVKAKTASSPGSGPAPRPTNNSAAGRQAKEPGDSTAAKNGTSRSTNTEKPERDAKSNEPSRGPGSRTPAGLPHTPPPLKAGVERLPPHSEEDLLRGLTLQAIWSENVEVTSLMNAALKIARLSPVASDADWNEAYQNFLQLFGMSKARLARQKSILQARQCDLESVLAGERSMRDAVMECDKAVAEAQCRLVKAKRHRRNHEQYETLATEVAKTASVADVEVVQGEELERKAKADKKVKSLEEQIARRQRQTEVVLKAAADLLQASQVDGVVLGPEKRASTAT